MINNNDHPTTPNHSPSFIHIPKITFNIIVNETLRDLLNIAFDDDNDEQSQQSQSQRKQSQSQQQSSSQSLLLLNGTTFPIIGQLRTEIYNAKQNVWRTLDNLLQSTSFQQFLSTTESISSSSSSSSSSSHGNTQNIHNNIVSEIATSGRLVIPINTQTNIEQQLGIIHDTSRSGKTVYIEPYEIIPYTDELIELQHQLQLETNKVWNYLVEQIMINSYDILQSSFIIGQLDLIIAKITFARKYFRGRIKKEQQQSAVIPVVKDEGIIQLYNAKHPVLLIRQQQKLNRNQQKTQPPVHHNNSDVVQNVVIGSDITLGVDHNRGLVLTGPNAGGKTIILKTIGLLAYMTKCGIPLPASYVSTANTSTTTIYNDDNDDDKLSSSQQSQPQQPPPRFDFFDPILADIGDIQSVDSDLSTFSGHMLVCRQVLQNVMVGGVHKNDETNTSKGTSKDRSNALVLLDELGSGTDPSQGVAIARSILESLVDIGTRVVVTTHYEQLKRLFTVDNRFIVGGMEFLYGKPTYRMKLGFVGESYAIDVARRLQLPPKIIHRAIELLDDDTKKMGELLRQLDEQNVAVQERLVQLDQQRVELQQQQDELLQELDRIQAERRIARQIEVEKFTKRIEEKEQLLENVLSNMRRSNSDSSSSSSSSSARKLVANSWNDIKYIKRDMINEVQEMNTATKDYDDDDDIMDSKVIAEAKKSRNKIRRSEEEEDDDDDDDEDDDDFSQQQSLVPIAEIRDKPILKIGDMLIVCKDGPLYGRSVIISKLMGKNRVEVNVMNDHGSGGSNNIMMNVVLKYTHIAMPPSKTNNNNNVKKSKKTKKNTDQEQQQTKKSSFERAAEKLLALEEKDSNSRGSSNDNDDDTTSSTSGSSGSSSVLNMRTSSNTIDVRGYNLNQAKEHIMNKFSSSIMSSSGSGDAAVAVYILHGHGTGGILKSKIRKWLSSLIMQKKRRSGGGIAGGGVSSRGRRGGVGGGGVLDIMNYQPADFADGGDGCTRVEIQQPTS